MEKMGEKSKRDYRAKACKQERANICAHSGTWQPQFREPLHPLVQTDVCPHVPHVRACIFMHLYMCKKGHGRALTQPRLGPNALGGAAAGPGHGCPAGRSGASPGTATPALIPTPAPTAEAAPARRHRPREAPCSVIHR